VSRKVEVDLKFLIIALSLVIIASVGSAFTAYLMLARFNNTDTQTVNAASKSELGPCYDIGEFTVNLADKTALRFIRTGIVLELKDNDVIKEAKKREPQIRDKIISVLRTCTVSDLSAPNGLENLRKAIVTSVNDLFVATDSVRDAFFVDLVFQ